MSHYMEVPARGVDNSDAVGVRGSKRPHVERHHCDLCPKSYSRRSSLLRHQEIAQHQPESSGSIGYACHNCGEIFTRKDSRDRHIEEVHLGKRRRYNDTGPSQQIIVAVVADHALANDEDRVEQSAIPDYQYLTHFIDFESLNTLPDGFMDISAQCKDYQCCTRDCDSFDELPHPDFCTGVEVECNECLASALNCPGTGCENNCTLPMSFDEPSCSNSTTASFENTQSLTPDPIKQRQRSRQPSKDYETAALRIPNKVSCTLCGMRPQTVNQVKQHAQTHLMQLQSASAASICEGCGISFKHEKDLDYHVKLEAQNIDCTDEAPFPDPILCQQPLRDQPKMQDGNKLSSDKLRDWELSQLTTHRLYIQDHNERTVRGADSDSTSSIFRWSTGVLSARFSLFTRTTRKTTPADIHYHTRHGEHHHKQFQVFARPAAMLRGGVDTVMEKAKGFPRTNENGNRYDLKHHMVQALRNCDTDQLRALINDGNSFMEAQGRDPNEKTAWSLFDDLMERCVSPAPWPGNDFQTRNFLACIDLLAKDRRVTMSEAAELAAGHDHEEFLRYLRDGVRVDVHSNLVEIAFCKAVLRKDLEVVANLLNQGSSETLLNALSLECFFTEEIKVINDKDAGRICDVAAISQYLRTATNEDNNALAAILVSSTLVKDLADLYRQIARNPCEEHVATKVQLEACRTCAEHYREKHNSWLQFTRGHSHRLSLFSRACWIEEMQARLACCFLPKIARAVFAEISKAL